MDNEQKSNLVEYKSFQTFEVKASEDDENVIEGYGSTFGNIDSYNDIVLPGAFAKSLAENKIRFLWQHDWDQPIGKIEELVEDENGLRLKARFANTAKAQEIRELVKMGAIDSFSIGYRAQDVDYDRDGSRLLKQVDLLEISVVTIPANDQAIVTAIKAREMTIRQLERKLRDSGFSPKDAQTLLSGGYKALCSNWDGSADQDLADLKSLIASRNELFKK